MIYLSGTSTYDENAINADNEEFLKMKNQKTTSNVILFLCVTRIGIE
jgi:hypothetical protein